MTIIQDFWPDPQPWDEWPPSPDIDLMIGAVVTVPVELVPFPSYQTTHMRVIHSAEIDGELWYYVRSEHGNSWATWLPLDVVCMYLTDGMLRRM